MTTAIDADGDNLPVQICLRAFLNGPGDFRIRSFPGDLRRIAAIRKNAKIRPATAHTMENIMPELSVVRAAKVISGSG